MVSIPLEIIKFRYLQNAYWFKRGFVLLSVPRTKALALPNPAIYTKQPRHGNDVTMPRLFFRFPTAITWLLQRYVFYASSFFTIAEMVLPSALPAIFFEAVPMTRPMSFIVEAPVSAITALTTSSISASVRGFGRYSSMT